MAQSLLRFKANASSSSQLSSSMPVPSCSSLAASSYRGRVASAWFGAVRSGWATRSAWAEDNSLRRAADRRHSSGHGSTKTASGQTAVTIADRRYWLFLLAVTIGTVSFPRNLILPATFAARICRQLIPDNYSTLFYNRRFVQGHNGWAGGICRPVTKHDHARFRASKTVVVSCGAPQLP